MEFFPDRTHVRLRSRVRGTYLCIDEDGQGISLSPRRESMNTVWRVHRVVYEDGADCVLLHSSAYGHYLGASSEPAPSGHRGHRAIPRPYAVPPQDDVAWEVQMAGDHVILSRHATSRLLRANGRYRVWNNGVSHDDITNRSTMMHWRVEAIPLLPAPPNLPRPTQEHPPRVSQRMIMYMRTETVENFNPVAAKVLMFEGRSVFQLRLALAKHLDEEDYSAITLCVRAGSQGRLIPLVTDLPRNKIPMIVAIVPTGSSAALELKYSDVNAP